MAECLDGNTLSLICFVVRTLEGKEKQRMTEEEDGMCVGRLNIVIVSEISWSRCKVLNRQSNDVVLTLLCIWILSFVPFRQAQKLLG